MPEDVKYKRGKVTAGDFTFKLKGLWLKNWLNWDNEQASNYEDWALDLMYRHNQFFERLCEVETYVTSKSRVHCSEQAGDEDIELQVIIDHGVIGANEQPVLTCADCDLENFNGLFDGCKVNHKKYKFSDDSCKSVWIGDKCDCFPILESRWKQPEDGDGELLIDIGDEEFVEALRSGAYLTCMYGGKIEVTYIPDAPEMPEEEEEEKDEASDEEEMLVTVEMLEEFGFYMGEDKDEFVRCLNEVLKEYGITTDQQIAYFMGQVAHESKFGSRTLEQFNLDSDKVIAEKRENGVPEKEIIDTPEKYFNYKYNRRSDIGNRIDSEDGQLYRGAGYIHLTGRDNYENFSNYLKEKYESGEIYYQDYNDVVSKGYEVVGGTYNKDINEIAQDEKGVIDVGKYAWESAAWFWTEGNPSGNDLNEYVDIGDWRSVSEAINLGETDDVRWERNEKINAFYEIITGGKSLNLPEGKIE